MNEVPATRRRLVILESPYASPSPDLVARNVRYAQAAVRDSVLRGEAPIASHLLFTQPGILMDWLADERALGIACGLAWIPQAEAMVVYMDLGMSPGMASAIDAAAKANLPVEIRRLEWWPGHQAEEA